MPVDFSRWPPLQPSWISFPIGTVLAIFDLHVTSMLPTKFPVNWPFSSGEERKIDFQGGSHCGHLGFLIRNDLGNF